MGNKTLKNFKWYSENFFIVAALLQGMLWMSDSAYLAVLPVVADALHTTTAMALYGASIFIVGMTSTNLVAGIICDKFDERKMLLIASIIFVLLHFLLIVYIDITSFLIIRFIMGAVGAFITMPLSVIVAKFYDHKKAPKVLALQGNITVLALSLAPLFGSIILDLFGDWHYIFIINAVCYAIVLIPLFYLLPKQNQVMDGYVYQESEVNFVAEDRHWLDLIKELLKDRMFILLLLGMSCSNIAGVTYSTVLPELLYDNFQITGYLYAFFSFIITVAIAFALYLGSVIGARIGVYNLAKYTLRGIMISCAILIPLNYAFKDPYLFTTTIALVSFLTLLNSSYANSIVIKRAKYKGITNGVKDTVISVLVMFSAMIAPLISGYVLVGVLIGILIFRFLAVFAYRHAYKTRDYEGYQNVNVFFNYNED